MEIVGDRIQESLIIPFVKEDLSLFYTAVIDVVEEVGVKISRLGWHII